MKEGNKTRMLYGTMLDNWYGAGCGLWIKRC
jgi:hypothetical protein